MTNLPLALPKWANSLAVAVIIEQEGFEKL
jgi:hypothetical protein